MFKTINLIKFYSCLLLMGNFHFKYVLFGIIIWIYNFFLLILFWKQIHQIGLQTYFNSISVSVTKNKCSKYVGVCYTFDHKYIGISYCCYHVIYTSTKFNGLWRWLKIEWNELNTKSWIKKEARYFTQSMFSINICEFNFHQLTVDYIFLWWLFNIVFIFTDIFFHPIDV